MKPPPLNTYTALSLWIDFGSGHYGRYRDWYEPEASTKPISLLTCPSCFRKFGTEYSVIRAVNSKKDKKCNDPLPQMLKTLCGYAESMRDPENLDRITDELNSHVGQHFTSVRAPSMISKVAAFLHPEYIVPFDSYAKGGVKKLDKSALPSDNSEKSARQKVMLARYQSFCADFEIRNESALNTAYRQLIEIAQGTLHIPNSRKTFRKRVVDLYLMAVGGRFNSSINYLDRSFIKVRERVFRKCDCRSR